MVAPDTCAEVSMIREGAEDASWSDVEALPVTAQGLSSSGGCANDDEIRSSSACGDVQSHTRGQDARWCGPVSGHCSAAMAVDYLKLLLEMAHYSRF